MQELFPADHESDSEDVKLADVVKAVSVVSSDKWLKKGKVVEKDVIMVKVVETVIMDLDVDKGVETGIMEWDVVKIDETLIMDWKC